MIAAIILAAGSSRRLGRPKQLVEYQGQTLVRRACDVAAASGCAPVLVVTGAHADAVEMALATLDVRTVHNTDHIRGVASSIVAGIAALPAVEGVILMTVDQPNISSEHLLALSVDPASAAGTAYDGTAGVPAYFPRSQFAELMALRGDQGAKALLREARAVTFAAAAFDVDTPKDLLRLET